MATTVISAFDSFLKNTVNLDPSDVTNAKSSRNWLITQIHSFCNNDSSFPDLYTEKDIYFGSFARKTKKRKLDDIDIMICLKAYGSTYSEYIDHIEIIVPDSATNLKKLCHDDTNILNSRKVINKFIYNLKNIPQYQKASLKLNQQAAVLNLTSYDWSFDIVPCFFTTEDVLGKTYYIIPDGNGHWMKTDPRIDRQRVSDINQANDGNVLNVIRTIKYWNKRPTMPSIKSYLLENIILDYYSKSYNECSKYVDIEIPKILNHLTTAIYSAVNDPKGIQGDLNTLPFEEKLKISNRASLDERKANEARKFETDKDYKASINKWREILGGDFPEYDE